MVSYLLSWCIQQLQRMIVCWIRDDYANQNALHEIQPSLSSYTCRCSSECHCCHRYVVLLLCVGPAAGWAASAATTADAGTQCDCQPLPEAPADASRHRYIATVVFNAWPGAVLSDQQWLYLASSAALTRVQVGDDVPFDFPYATCSGSTAAVPPTNRELT